MLGPMPCYSPPARKLCEFTYHYMKYSPNTKPGSLQGTGGEPAGDSPQGESGVVLSRTLASLNAPHPRISNYSRPACSFFRCECGLLCV